MYEFGATFKQKIKQLAHFSQTHTHLEPLAEIQGILYLKGFNLHSLNPIKKNETKKIERMIIFFRQLFHIVKKLANAILFIISISYLNALLSISLNR